MCKVLCMSLRQQEQQFGWIDRQSALLYITATTAFLWQEGWWKGGMQGYCPTVHIARRVGRP
jgi:hypothetical protein